MHFSNNLVEGLICCPIWIMIWPFSSEVECKIVCGRGDFLPLQKCESFDLAFYHDMFLWDLAEYGRGWWLWNVVICIIWSRVMWTSVCLALVKNEGPWIQQYKMIWQLKRRLIVVGLKECVLMTFFHIYVQCLCIVKFQYTECWQLKLMKDNFFKFQIHCHFIMYKATKTSGIWSSVYHHM